MKKIFTLLVLFPGLIYLSAFSQDRNSDLDPSIQGKQAFDIQVDNRQQYESRNPSPILDNSSIVVLPTDGGNSQNGRAPQGGRRYIRTIYLIKPSEMVTSGFGSDLVTSIGWSYLFNNVQFPQNIATQCDNLIVYMMSTTDVTNTRGPLGWTAGIAGMTKVYEGPYSIPSGLGPFNIDINLGGPGTSPFSTIAGEGVYIAFQYTNAANPICLTTAAGNVDCNFQGLTSGAYTGQSQTAHVNTLGASSFRAATRFGGSTKPLYIDVGSVSTLAANGRAAVCVCPDSNRVTYAIDHLRNQPDVLITKVQVINVVGGTVKIEWIDTLISNSVSTNYRTHAWLKDGDSKKLDSIVIEILPVAGENVLYNNRTNHRNAYVKQTTLNKWNYSIPTDTVNGGFGLNNNFPARTAVCYKTSCALTLCGVDLIFNRIDLLNNKPYHIEVYGDNAGSPGAVIYSSPGYRVPATNLGEVPVSHEISPPIVIPAGNYYVAAVQDSLVNFGLGFQWEGPMRTGTFFFKNATQTVWTDAGSAGGAGTFIFRPSVGVRTTLNLNIGYWLEGFFNGSTMVPDTVKVVAHSLSTLIGLDTAYSVVDASGLGVYEFCRLNNDSCYIYQIRHRNHIQIWSTLSCEQLDECDVIYDFRNSAANTFGSNVVFVSADNSGAGGYAAYTGDVNQDDIVDGSDCSDVDNDAFNFITGYVTTDLNGDEIVDGTDGSYCDNNAFNFVGAVIP